MRRVILKKRKDLSPSNFNSARTAKVSIRHELLCDLGVDNPAILDVYAGPGTMWRDAYSSASNYLGLDRTQYDDGRKTVVCDNTRFLRLQTFDIDAFDIFDLDAFGSPAYPLAIICNRLRWSRVGKVGMLLTDGTGFNAKMNSASSGLLRYLGVSRHRGSKVQHDMRDDILSALILKTAADARATVSCIRRVSRRTGSGMRYVSYLLTHRP